MATYVNKKGETKLLWTNIEIESFGPALAKAHQTVRDAFDTARKAKTAFEALVNKHPKMAPIPAGEERIFTYRTGVARAEVPLKVKAVRTGGDRLD
jgi:hypothetical protein